MKHNKIAVVGIAASMLVGAGSGLLLNLPGGAGASGTAGSSVQADPADPAAPTEAGNAGNEGHSRPKVIVEESLAELVAAGTITQEQADAIAATIKANRPEGFPGGGHGGGGQGGGHHGGPGGGHGGGMRKGESLDAAATALGITAEELRIELKAGKTVAEVAGDNGIDVQTVIDAVVAQRTEDITERVTNFVNGTRPTPADDQAAPQPEGDEPTPTTTG